MSDDPDLNDGLAFLREREIVHSQRFREAVEILKEGQLSYYKIPEYVFLIDEYPLTASGKVQKYVLRDRAEELLASPVQ